MPSAVQQQHSRSCGSDDVQCHTDVGLLESEDLLFHTHPLPAELCCSDAHTNLC